MSTQQKRIAAISAHFNASKYGGVDEARSVLRLDKDWLFKQLGADAVVSEFLPTARFPTDIYSDLLHHGLIPDPFRGLNEQDVQWVSEKAWIYRTTFETPKNASKCRKAVLIVEGLDTFATVTLNGKEILSTDNIFIRYDVDVKTLLRPDGANVLEIVFENAVEKAEVVMKSLSYHKWGTMGGNPKRTAVRKAQYHFVR